jgi:homoserine dehydrogenase
MSKSTRITNRRRQRNSPKVPLLLMVLIGGGLVGTKWVCTVQAKHEELSLESQERQLVSQIEQCKLDIINQQGRIKELAARDQVRSLLPKHNIRMVEVQKESVITLPQLQPGGGK